VFTSLKTPIVSSPSKHLLSARSFAPQSGICVTHTHTPKLKASGCVESGPFVWLDVAVVYWRRREEFEMGRSLKGGAAVDGSSVSVRKFFNRFNRNELIDVVKSRAELDAVDLVSVGLSALSSYTLYSSLSSPSPTFTFVSCVCLFAFSLHGSRGAPTHTLGVLLERRVQVTAHPLVWYSHVDCFQVVDHL
jgi:hypothetical protein